MAKDGEESQDDEAKRVRRNPHGLLNARYVLASLRVASLLSQFERGVAVMDSFQATQRIREIEAQTKSAVPIIALTASATKV